MLSGSVPATSRLVKDTSSSSEASKNEEKNPDNAQDSQVHVQESSPFPKFTFSEQSINKLLPSYPAFTFSEQNNKKLLPNYLTFVFSEQSSSALSPIYPLFTFLEQNSNVLIPNYPKFTFESHKGINIHGN